MERYGGRGIEELEEKDGRMGTVWSDREVTARQGRWERRCRRWKSWDRVGREESGGGPVVREMGGLESEPDGVDRSLWSIVYLFSLISSHPKKTD